MSTLSTHKVSFYCIFTVNRNFFLENYQSVKDNLVSNRTTRQNLREIYSNVLLLSPFVERKFYEGQSFGFWSKFRVAKKINNIKIMNIEYPSVRHPSQFHTRATFLVPKIRHFSINP